MKPITIHAHRLRSKPTHARNIDILPVLFLVTALFCLPAGSDSPALNSLAIVFVSIVLEAIPFMLVGALVGGLIEAFVSHERLAAMLPKNGWRTVCVAAAAGILFPVCECAVVPVVRRLMGKGLPFSAAIAYLLAGPIVNPVVAVSTALAYAFDWRVVALRLALGYVIAVIIGLVMGRIFASTPPGILGIMDTTMVQGCGCGCSHAMAADDWLGKVGSAFCHAIDDFLAVGHYLVIGAFIAALSQTYIERSTFLTVTGAPFLAEGLMMLLAILLNLCSEADAFIAASMQGIMPLSAQMAFMLTGPMFDLKLLLMYGGIFRRRVITILVTFILLVVFVASIGLGWIEGTCP
ncbi:permease [Desulfosarcina ovata]|uniref:UPF0718 protein YcgR n=1 Tax=Desulfosarcina ovata subsp. ovata TaxID=2752305 RepID=A0A5K8AIG0_9BACT|nr:permease [Desulfosarcina ovata]BBO92472.1 UPF0718 protein YcgR [Desulfosarcina ovata subsp. ovata]